MSVTALIAGAGSGTRLGADRPKALVELGGKALIVHAIAAMNVAGVTDVLVTVPTTAQAEFENVIGQAGLRARLVPGGQTRQESVQNALALVDTDFVVVHDAARALTPVSLIESVIEALGSHRAVIPALEVADTIKVVENDLVSATLERAKLRAVQTPQGFATELLRRAHEAASFQEALDDAALVEALGEPVFVVPGAARALKITTEWDLAVAQMMVQ